MTITQVLLAVGTVAVALLFGESLLTVLHLHRIRVGGLLWGAGVIALLLAVHWADQRGWPAGRDHLLALAVAGVLTAAWFNDHRPAPRRADTATALASDRGSRTH